MVYIIDIKAKLELAMAFNETARIHEASYAKPGDGHEAAEFPLH
jgi:hypothetical protein